MPGFGKKKKESEKKDENQNAGKKENENSAEKKSSAKNGKKEKKKVTVNKKNRTSPGKKKDYTTYIILGIVAYVFIILLSLDAAYLATADKDLNVLSAFFGALTDVMSLDFHFALNGHSITYILVASFVFAFFIVYQYNESVRHARDDKSKGDAKWTENLNEYNSKYVDNENQFNNIILTDNISLSMNSRKTMRNCNVLVVGGSGSGKTRFMIKPNLLQANCSFVVTDPKGAILEAEGEMLRSQGYRIKVFNLVDMVHSDSYNPFNYIRDDNGVLMLINCLIKNTNDGKSGGDPFWEKSETALLQALIFYLIKKKGISEDQKNFSEVMKLMREAQINEDDPDEESDLDRRFAELEKEDPNSIALTQYKVFKMGAGKTLKSILISAAVRLTTFNLPDVQNLTMRDTLDLKSIADEKTALFVIIPAADDTFNYLVSMLYSQLFETLYYRAENECPHEYYIKNGPDVLAIARKNERGDKYTRQDAEKLLQALKKADLKRQRTPGKDGKTRYYIKAGKFTREFGSEEFFDEYKRKLEKAEIVKGSIRLPYQVRFLLDEFANIGQIPDFTKKLATMREYEISCTIILQNLAQIKTMYKDDWESIVGNCDSFLFLGGQEYSTLEYISKLLGKTTVTSMSRSLSIGKGGTSQSYSHDGKELMSTDQLSTMPKSDCICIINGMHPFYGPKYNLLRHPHYHLSGDASEENKFDYKKEVLNYGASRNATPEIPESEPGTEPGNEDIARPMESLKNAAKKDPKKIEDPHIDVRKTANVPDDYNFDFEPSFGDF